MYGGRSGGMMAGGAANREKEDEVKYDMMENLTARFNIGYHGRKIIADVKRQNFEAHRDNYQQLLPVLIEPTEAMASSNIQLMDSVIGKARDLLTRKSDSRYINEAYPLTVKAHHLKGNYDQAGKVFKTGKVDCRESVVHLVKNSESAVT